MLNTYALHIDLLSSVYKPRLVNVYMINGSDYIYVPYMEDYIGEQWNYKGNECIET